MDNKIPAGELIVPAEPARKFAAQWAAQKKTDAWKFAGARSASTVGGRVPVPHRGRVRRGDSGGLRHPHRVARPPRALKERNGSPQRHPHHPRWRPRHRPAGRREHPRQAGREPARPHQLDHPGHRPDRRPGRARQGRPAHGGVGTGALRRRRRRRSGRAASTASRSTPRPTAPRAASPTPGPAPARWPSRSSRPRRSWSRW
jgi:hypothetical protein